MLLLLSFQTQNNSAHTSKAKRNVIGATKKKQNTIPENYMAHNILPETLYTESGAKIYVLKYQSSIDGMELKRNCSTIIYVEGK